MKKSIFSVSLSFLLVFLACDDIIEVPDISGENVTILAPTNEAVITNSEITFTWDVLEDADNYKLQIATPNFENAAQIVTDSILPGTSFVRTLESGNYEWRVRAQNSAYATTYSSTIFIVNATTQAVNISNESVVITAPADNSTFNTTDTVNFTWETLTGASEYQIEIVTPDFDNPTQTIENTTITETTFSINSLEVGSYQWRVKAKNAQYETNYTTQSFTIQ